MNFRKPYWKIEATGWPALIIMAVFSIYTLEAILRTILWLTSKF